MALQSPTCKLTLQISVSVEAFNCQTNNFVEFTQGWGRGALHGWLRNENFTFKWSQRANFLCNNLSKISQLGL